MTRHTDTAIIQAIESAGSFAEAAAALRMSNTWTRKQAHRLGVRTRFRYGAEKLPKGPTLKRLLREARTGHGISHLARSLGVTRQLLTERAAELGVVAQLQVRAGLPDDETLRREMESCLSFAEVARQYGVEGYVIRNQAKRLGVPTPSKRARG